MAGHPIPDEQFPDINPQGAPSGDTENIHASPEAFGGLLGHAEQTLGAGLDRASNEGFETLDLQNKLQAQTHAAELHSWQSDQTTDAQEGFLSLKGKSASMALPDFKKQIQDYHDQAVSQAGNPYTKLMVEQDGRRLVDITYAQAARHAATEQSVWQSNTAKNASVSFGDSAVLSAVQSRAPKISDDLIVNDRLFKSDQEIRNFAESQGYDGPALNQEVSKNRGRNVEQIVKQITGDGSQVGLQRAIDFFHSQFDKIDPASRVTIEQSLRTQAAAFDGRTAADQYMGRGQNAPPGYISRTFQIESGGNNNAVTGSNRGPAQFGKAEEARYGINDSNWNDPVAHARALSLENQDNHDALAKALGHEPTPADYYFAHQQGIGGAVSHFSQPNLPAWQNMASTGEGRQKGDGWAKQAIWGNMTPEMKAQFPGGVESVTSGDFSRMWAQRFNGTPIQATGAVPDGSSPSKFSGAQSFAQTNKADVLTKLQNDPDLIDHPQAMQAAISHVNQVFETESASYADQERQIKIQKLQQEQTSDAAENKYLQDIYSPSPKTSIQQVVADPSLTREAKARIVAVAGDPGERDAKTYGSGFEQAFRDIHAPAGDPSRITDPAQLYNRLGANADPTLRLSMAGVEKLRAELDLKKSPEGEAEAEMKRQFLVNAKAQITGTNLDMHMKDHKGDEQYLKFMANVLPAYDAGRKDGKTPAELLNPDSPDYVGKSIKNFVRPPAQWSSDILHDNLPPGEEQQGSKTYDNVQDLVTAYRAGQITKADADAMAIEKGWAMRKPPTPVAPQLPLSQ